MSLPLSKQTKDFIVPVESQGQPALAAVPHRDSLVDSEGTAVQARLAWDLDMAQSF